MAAAIHHDGSTPKDEMKTLKETFPAMANNSTPQVFSAQLFGHRPTTQTPVVSFSGEKSDHGDSVDNDDEEMFRVPRGMGLLLRLDSVAGRLYVELKEDGHYVNIHPNCFAPSEFSQEGGGGVTLLHGGGSGSAVFEGFSTKLGGRTIMKHAGPKDTEEVLSLARIETELQKRGALHAPEAAAFLKARIPRFLFCYLSPHHVRDRGVELWGTLRVRSWKALSHELKNMETASSSSSSSHSDSEDEVETQTIEKPHEEKDEKIQEHTQPKRDESKGGLLEEEQAPVLRGKKADTKKDEGHNPLRATVEPKIIGEDVQKEEADDEDQKVSLTNIFAKQLRNQFLSALTHELARREIWIARKRFEAKDDGNPYEIKLEIKSLKLVMHFPHLQYEPKENACYIEHAQEALDSFTYTLIKQQEKRAWKCTLAQSPVGGPASENGAVVLLSRRLQGQLLHDTVRDFIRFMQYLGALTLPEERQGIVTVRAEVERLEAKGEENLHVDDVSRKGNEFCGTALRKNFMPETGRFSRLRHFGLQFRRCHPTFCLNAKELVPAKFLGQLLSRGSDLANVFCEPPSRLCALDHLEQMGWFRVLKLATSFDNKGMSENSRRAINDCIWTCGLTDAGLHNTFVDSDRGLELFDLGAPQLMPMPAFLTKFLMSFFHILGMEEGAEKDNWVCRFQVVEGSNKLALTLETQALLPYIHSNFDYTVNHLIDGVFYGQDNVRHLLLTYTVLQLVSDASFCLDRWDQKGGGRAKLEGRNPGFMEKWLWRAVWDLYIASEVYEKLLQPFSRNAP